LLTTSFWYTRARASISCLTERNIETRPTLPHYNRYIILASQSLRLVFLYTIPNKGVLNHFQISGNIHPFLWNPIVIYRKCYRITPNIANGFTYRSMTFLTKISHLWNIWHCFCLSNPSTSPSFLLLPFLRIPRNARHQDTWHDVFHWAEELLKVIGTASCWRH
jgi:hypothetical protein